MYKIEQVTDLIGQSFPAAPVLFCALSFISPDNNRIDYFSSLVFFIVRDGASQQLGKNVAVFLARSVKSSCKLPVLIAS
jgi:hypothetical protein